MVDDAQNRSHQIGTEAILAFGEGAGGRIIHVRDVLNGKRCNCICPECRKPLVANQGRKKAWHFAHYGGSTCNPKKALETALHRLAKQLIQERGEIALPPVIAVVGNSTQTIGDGRVFRPTEVNLEVAMSDMRPDIVARRDDETLFIEIAVWHKVGRPKQVLIEERRQATIEIDLKAFLYETNVANLEKQILYDAPREWLFNLAQYELEEPARKATEAAAAALRARHEAVAQLVVSELDTPPIAAPPPGSVWAALIKKIEVSSFGDAIGISIEGGGAFSVASRIWQAMVLAKIIWSGAPFVPVANLEFGRLLRGTLRQAVAAACQDPDTNWNLIEEMTGRRVRPPHLVLWDYLNLMARRGVLSWSAPGTIGPSRETSERVRAIVQQMDYGAQRPLGPGFRMRSRRRM